MNPKELRKLYNHSLWPSPRAVNFCKQIGIDKNRIIKKDSIGNFIILYGMECIFKSYICFSVSKVGFIITRIKHD